MEPGVSGWSLTSTKPCGPQTSVEYLIGKDMFSTEISITIEKDLVRFTKKQEVLELKPVVYLDHSHPPRILSVGAPPSEPVASRIVCLFDGQDCEEDKVLILEAFFRFGFRQILGGPFSLAPKVSLDISPDIVASLGGYHRVIFHYCSKMAGAASTPYENRYGKA